jgi:hypothetical protein
MPKIFENMHHLFKSFSNRKGTIEFTSGEYKLFVYKKIKKHEKVWFHIDESNDSTCSYLSNNEFNITQKENGFILVANVDSNKVKFYWYILHFSDMDI